jgi:hypothetical protein
MAQRLKASNGMGAVHAPIADARFFWTMRTPANLST